MARALARGLWRRLAAPVLRGEALWVGAAGERGLVGFSVLNRGLDGRVRSMFRG